MTKARLAGWIDQAGSGSDKLDTSSDYELDHELDGVATQDSSINACPDRADSMVPITQKRTASEGFLPSTESPERATSRGKRSNPASRSESEKYHWKIPFVSVQRCGWELPWSKMGAKSVPEWI